MPLNRGSHISQIIDETKWVSPESILDVGCGWGLMGAVFRAFTDASNLRLHESEWKTKIDGIEIFEPYKNKCWEMYDNVYGGDALVEIDKLGKYDMIYCGDMIEHLTKENGHKLIEKMQKHVNKWIFIATPMPARPQEPILGNAAEQHLSDWTEEDFKKYDYEMVGSFGWGHDYILVVRIRPAQ